MLEPQKKGLFLSSRVVGASRNCDGMIPGERKGGEMLGGGAISNPKVPPLGGDGADSDGKLREAEVWRQPRDEDVLDEAMLHRKEREALSQRISELEKELYQYQYHMGLLLIDKKEFGAKYEKMRQEISEATLARKNMQATHISTISEFEKREGSLRKAMEFQRQSIVNLEKALNEMHAETAELKLEYQKKLSEAQALEATVEEKYLEVKGKLHSLDVILADVSRKSSDADRRLEDVEAREEKLSRQSSSFSAEKLAFEKDLAQQRENLRAWEQELQDNQKRLAEWNRFLNEREMKSHEREKSSKKNKKKLENLKGSIRLKEDQDICMRLRILGAQGKKVLQNQEMVEKKEKELLATEEKLSNEEADLQNSIDYHNSIVQSRKEEFELETEKKRTVDEHLKRRSDPVVPQEIILENRKSKILKKEQHLENEMRRLKSREDIVLLNELKETNGKEEQTKERIKLEKERELLGKRRLSIEESLNNLCGEEERFNQRRHSEEEILRKEIMEVSDHIHMNLEDSRLMEETFTDKTSYRKINAVKTFDRENVHIADSVDVCIMQGNQEHDKEATQEQERDHSKCNITINNCIVLSNQDESETLIIKEQKDQLNWGKEEVLGNINNFVQTTPGVVVHKIRDQVEEPPKEGDYFTVPAQHLMAYWRSKDRGDTILPQHPDESDLATCPSSVQLDARMSCMQKCPRLLEISPEKKTAETIDKSVCTDAEPSVHEDNLEPGLLHGNIHAFQWSQYDSGIQYNARPERSNEDAIKHSLDVPDCSTDFMKLNDSVRDMEEVTFPSPNRLEKDIGSPLLELDSVSHPLKLKQCNHTVRRKPIYVKKSRSVNALIKDDNLEISQSKYNALSNCKAQNFSPKFPEVGYYYYGDQAAVNSGKRRLPLRYGMNTKREREYAGAHSKNPSSVGYSTEMENSSRTAIQGLKHYNFRRSTIMRAVTASEPLAFRSKRKRIGLQKLFAKGKLLKLVEHNGEGAQGHTCASDNLG